MQIISDTTGYTSGPSIRLCNEEVLSACRPDWTQDPQSNTIENFMYDENAPETVKVYPPAGSDAYAEMVHVPKPVDCATVNDPISVPDKFASFLVYMVVARAFAIDQEVQDAAKSDRFYQRALESIGLKSKQDLLTSPNTTQQGGYVPRVLRGGA
jgi:hypothetical protein